MSPTRIMLKSKIHRTREHKPILVGVDSNNVSNSAVATH